MPTDMHTPADRFISELRAARLAAEFRKPAGKRIVYVVARAGKRIHAHRLAA